MFERVIADLRKIKIDKIALKEFEKMKEEAFDLNTEDQLFSKGIDSKGQSLGSYAPLSVTLRREAGLPVDRITTRITGAFHRGWKGNFKRWPVVFDSTDPKTGELLFQFGEDLFGLTNSSLNKLLDEGLYQRIQEASAKSFSSALEGL